MNNKTRPLFLLLHVYSAIRAAIAAVVPGHRMAIIVFSPSDPRTLPAVYSNASATDLAPVLETVRGRIGSGALRMPVTSDAIRWVDVLNEEPAPD